MTIITDNTEAAALLAVRVRELEKQIEAADKLRGVFSLVKANDEVYYIREKLFEAIAAYYAARGK